MGNAYPEIPRCHADRAVFVLAASLPLSPAPRKSPTVPLPMTMALITEGSLQFLCTELAGTLHQEKLTQLPSCSSWSSLVGHGSSGFVPEVKHTSVAPCIKGRMATITGVSYTCNYWANFCRLAEHRWYSQAAHHCLRGLWGTQSCFLAGWGIDEGCLMCRSMKTHDGTVIASHPEGTSAPWDHPFHWRCRIRAWIGGLRKSNPSPWLASQARVRSRVFLVQCDTKRDALSLGKSSFIKHSGKFHMEKTPVQR